MERVIFRHISGSKANQVEEFPLAQFVEAVVGRDPGSTVKYDPARDDLVGRQHARIARDPASPYHFTITDLNSRNGTFVNKQRIVGTTTMSPGDVVQFGAGGPEFEFTIDPLPPEFVKATRLAAAPGAQPPATRVVDAAAPPAKTAVGKATVERMVTDATKRTRTSMFAVIAAVVVLAGAIGAYFWYRSATREQRLTAEIGQTKQQLEEAKKAAPLTPVQIAAAATESTVYIEVGWKLIHTRTGQQLYHAYFVLTDDQGRRVKRNGEEVPPMPIYVRMPDGELEPDLALDSGRFGQNKPIGTQHTGSGFVVTSDGFVLTNRHVAATWETSYGFPDAPSVVRQLGDNKLSPLENPPADWVPANARLVGGRPLDGKSVEGRLDYLDVTFAKSRLRAPAKLARVSDRHDVAMIKVDLPTPLKKVELYDNYQLVQPGQSVTVMGYPGVSPLVSVVARSQDVFSRDSQEHSVPDPTVTPGAIGRVLRGDVVPAGSREYTYFSRFGDSYQMTVNPGQGNSGGPVFDERGRVIAIYTAFKMAPGAVIAFATPIRYGLELMQVGAAMK